MEIGTLCAGADTLKEVLAGWHLLRGGSVGEQANFLVAGALQEPLAYRNLLRVVYEGAGSLILLSALAELVEEHAVLFASILIF